MTRTLSQSNAASLSLSTPIKSAPAVPVTVRPPTSVTMTTLAQVVGTSAPASGMTTTAGASFKQESGARAVSVSQTPSTSAIISTQVP